MVGGGEGGERGAGKGRGGSPYTSRGRHLRSRWRRQMVEGKKGRWGKKKEIACNVFIIDAGLASVAGVRVGGRRSGDILGVEGNIAFLKERGQKRKIWKKHKRERSGVKKPPRPSAEALRLPEMTATYFTFLKIVLKRTLHTGS